MSIASLVAMAFYSLNYEAGTGSKYVVDLMRTHWNAC